MKNNLFIINNDVGSLSSKELKIRWLQLQKLFTLKNT